MKLHLKLATIALAAMAWVGTGSAQAGFVIDSFTSPAGDSTASTTSSLTAIETVELPSLVFSRTMTFDVGGSAAAGGRVSLTRGEGYLDLIATNGARVALQLHYDLRDPARNLAANPILAIDLTSFDVVPQQAGDVVLETVLLARVNESQIIVNRNQNILYDDGPRTLYYHFHNEGVHDPIDLSSVLNYRLIIVTAPNAHLRLSNFRATDLSEIPTTVPEPAAVGTIAIVTATVLLRRRRNAMA